MLQQGYYDVVQAHSEVSSGSESNNNTPFSVKDILNMVDQNAAAAAAAAAAVDADYLGCQMDRCVCWMLIVVTKKFLLANTLLW